MSLLESKYFGKEIKIHLKEFAQIFAIIGLIISAVLLHKYHGQNPWSWYLIFISAGLLAIGYFFPIILYPFWKAWMTLAHLLGMVVNFVILSITWVFLMIPIALLLKLIGKKVMEIKLDPSAATYWETRKEKTNFKLLERQY